LRPRPKGPEAEARGYEVKVEARGYEVKVEARGYEVKVEAKAKIVASRHAFAWELGNHVVCS